MASSAMITPGSRPIDASLPGSIERSHLVGHRPVVVHDSSRFAVPRSANLLKDSALLYIPSMNHKIAAQVTGLGYGYLPLPQIASLLADGRPVRTQLAGETGICQQLFLVWKTSNRGNGLQSLVKKLGAISRQS